MDVVSRGIGGTTALNYLIEVKGYSFIEVVETITGKQVVVAPKPIKQDNKYYDRPLSTIVVQFIIND